MFDDSCKVYWAHADHIHFHDALNAWCDGSPGCIEAKKHALQSKLESGVVKYRRADLKTFEATIYELIAKQNLLVEKVSFVEWASSVSEEDESQRLQKNLKVSSRSANAQRAIIGALLDVIFEKSFSGKPYSNFGSQADLIEKILLKHGHIDGISQRNLEGKFAEAKKHLNSM